MTDRIEVDYVQLEKIVQQLRGRNDDLEQHYNQLLSKLRELETQWEGRAADTFFNEMADKALPAYRRLMHALSQTQNTLGQVANVMRTAEEQASNLFKSSGATGEFGAVGGGGLGIGGGAGGGFGNTPDGNRVGLKGWFGISENRGFSFLSGDSPFNRNISMGTFPSFLQNSRFATQTELLRQYLGGEINHRQANEFLRLGKSFSFDEQGRLQITDNPEAIIGLGDKDRVLPNYLDASAKFEVFKLQGEATAFEHIFGNENANLRVSALSVEGDLSGRMKIGSDGIDIGVEGSAGAYLARLQGSIEMNGFRAMGDAYVGATASGQAGVIFDPLSGDVKVTIKGEAFIGAEAKGSIGYSNDLFSVELQGSVSAGAGVRGQFDVGLDDGRLKLDAGFLGAVGVGGGAGIKVEVNLNEVADVVTDTVGDAMVGAGEFISDVGNTLKNLF